MGRIEQPEGFICGDKCRRLNWGDESWLLWAIHPWSLEGVLTWFTGRWNVSSWEFRVYTVVFVLQARVGRLLGKHTPVKMGMRGSYFASWSAKVAFRPLKIVWPFTILGGLWEHSFSGLVILMSASVNLRSCFLVFRRWLSCWRRVNGARGWCIRAWHFSEDQRYLKAS